MKELREKHGLTNGEINGIVKEWIKKENLKKENLEKEDN